MKLLREWNANTKIRPTYARTARYCSSQAKRQSGGFATVDYRHDANSGLTLSLPNDLVLRGISVDNVPVVRQLLEQL